GLTFEKVPSTQSVKVALTVTPALDLSTWVSLPEMVKPVFAGWPCASLGVKPVVFLTLFRAASAIASVSGLRSDSSTLCSAVQGPRVTSMMHLLAIVVVFRASQIARDANPSCTPLGAPARCPGFPTTWKRYLSGSGPLPGIGP